MTNKHILFAALFAALLAMPALASAQAASEEGDAEEATETEADTAEGETEEAAVVADEAAPVEEAKEATPAPEPEKASPVQGTWTKKLEFATEDGMFKFQPTGFVQPKLQLLINPDATDQMAGSGFVFQRARMGFRAGLFKFARLYLDADFKTGAFNLVDYFADVDPWNGIFAVRAGRFRPWFGRQFMAGTTSLQMIETAKAWTDDKLGLGMDRDLGVGVFGLIADTFEYGLGVWNGDGGTVYDNKERKLDGTTGVDGNTLVAPANIDVMVGGRLAVHPLAPLGVGRALPLGDESDSAISEKPGLALGVSVMFNKRHDRSFAVPVGAGTADALYYDNQLKLGVDLAFQMKGLSVVGELFLHKVWLPSDARPEIKDAIDLASGLGPKGVLVDGMGLGTYVQIGYFVIAKKLEVAARFDMVDEKTKVRGTRLYPGIGASYYFFGNNLKVQLMYRLNMSTKYGKITDADGVTTDDPGYIPTSHDLFLMLQASI
jgi:hypothetical protein